MLVILGIIPVVNLIVLGYLGNVLKEPKDSKQLPPLDNYVELWISGLKIGIVSLVYMIIPFLLVVSFFDFWGVFSFLSDIRGSAAMLMNLVGALLAFFSAIILIMAIINMVKHDNNISKAFAFGEVLERIKRIGWGNYIMWLFAIFVCLVIISALGRILMILWFLAILIAPVVGVFLARSASLLYSEGNPAPETTEATDQT